MQKTWRINVLAGMLIYLVSSSINATQSLNTQIAIGSYKTTQKYPPTRPLLTVSNNDGANWFYPSDIFSKSPSDSFGMFQTASCHSDYCIASGMYADKSYSTHPLIAESKNHGASWSYVTIVEPKNILLFNDRTVTSCNSTNCVIGMTYTDKQLNSVPLMAISKNKGASWIYSTIPSPTPLKDLILSDLDCTDKTCVAIGSNTKPDGLRAIRIAVSTDQAVTWSYSELNFPAEYLNDGGLASVKCKDNICVAIGNYHSSNDNIFILRSTDGGISWSDIPTGYKPHAGRMGVSNISYSDNTWIITGIAAPEDHQSITLPLVFVSQDNGMSWSQPPTIISKLPPLHSTTLVQTDRANCIDELCVVPIYRDYTSAEYKEFIFALAISYDHGVNWSYVDISPSDVNAAEGRLGPMSCNKQSCIAAGSYKIIPSFKSKPFVIVSNDHGKTWYSPTSILSNLPTDFQEGELFNSFNTKEFSYKKHFGIKAELNRMLLRD